MNDEQFQAHLKALAEAKDGRPYDDKNRQLVIECLHHNGSKRNRLTNPQFVQAYLLCNGFGDIDIHTANDQCYDFSHVRDSSPIGIDRCAEFLKSLHL